MNPIRNGGRQDLLSLHLDVVLPRPRASISVTALRFSHREVLEQGGGGGKGSWKGGKFKTGEHFCSHKQDMHKKPLLKDQVKLQEGNNDRRANVNGNVGSGT